MSTFGRIIKEAGGLRFVVCGRNVVGFASVRRLSRLQRTTGTTGV